MAAFPGAETLGAFPRYGEPLLAVIDSGVGDVIDRTDAVAIARTLGLYVTVAVDEKTGDAALAPDDSRLFDLNWLHTPLGPETTDEAFAELDRLLVAAGVEPFDRSELLDRFQDPLLSQRVPNGGLRAALLLLSTISPWDEVAQSLIEDDRIQIGMESLRLTVPAIQRTGPDGSRQIFINDRLSQESLPVLAAALVEGSLLDSASLSEFDVSSAAAFSTLAYGDLILIDPATASSRTWGSISRNRDLLALLNSAAFLPGYASPPGSSPGLAGTSNVLFDVLPGVAIDARSFEDYVLTGTRGQLVATERFSVASDLFLNIAEQTGMNPDPSVSVRRRVRADHRRDRSPSRRISVGD